MASDTICCIWSGRRRREEAGQLDATGVGTAGQRFGRKFGSGNPVIYSVVDGQISPLSPLAPFTHYSWSAVLCTSGKIVDINYFERSTTTSTPVDLATKTGLGPWYVAFPFQCEHGLMPDT